MHKTQFNVCVLYGFCNMKLEFKKKMYTVFNYCLKKKCNILHFSCPVKNVHLTSLEGNKHNFLKMSVLMFQKVQNYRFSETIDMYVFIPP